MEIGIIGGTGAFGSGLALRLAKTGYDVWVGSRTEERARQVVEAELAPALAASAGAAEEAGATVGRLVGASNEEVARMGEVAMLAVPARASDEFLESLRPHLDGKILIDCTVTLDPKEPTMVPAGHTATALRTQAVLGSGVTVVTGFHTIAAAKLAAIERPLEGDTFIAGDDQEAKEVAMGLARRMGLRPFDVGPLAAGATLERMTALLIGLNKRYKRRSIGFRLTDV